MDTNADATLTDEEFDELDAFLVSEQMPEEGMDISTVDGFLAAIVLNPEEIVPGRWLPWVWDMDNGEKSPAFSSAEEASRITGYLMRHYDGVVQSIAEGWFDPLLLEVESAEGEFLDAEGWSTGFMIGVSMFLETWQPVLQEHPQLVTPMVLLGTDDGWEILDASEDPKRAIQEAYEAIPAVVQGLHAYFKPQRDRAADAAS